MGGNPDHGDDARPDRVVGRRTALKVPLILAGGASLTRTPRATAAGPGRWSADRANGWYRAQRRLVGANYIPSNAINQLEMFQPDTYDPRRIDAELGMARQLGFNTVRVFLHDLLWAQDRAGFLRRLDAVRRHRGAAMASNRSSSSSTPAGIRTPSSVRSARRRPACTTPAGCRAPAPNASATPTTAAFCTTTSRG